MSIAVVKYNAGNIHSVLSALGRLGTEAVVTDDKEALKSASRVIFPGVGEAKSAMDYLRAKGLDTILRNLRQPFLGICLGMQLMCGKSEEGPADCLGIFPGVTVTRFPKEGGAKIPHVGWNTLALRRGQYLFQDLGDQAWCYFVHSYYVPLSPYSVALTSYDGITFSSALHKDNFWGCQFHPEKSADAGEKILRRFLEVE